ncbi:MAG: 3-deoxy-7-phosphoheptulonate synthase [Bacteroidaceae bacterium]|nr:3-deoxy-7-phosphoheptulonate synthase [Bacteroidaceae bacterium]MBR5962837.1 3-deoxy-7-phosphoheptulonate synthase [Bacteroidaceae bacterium]
MIAVLKKDVSESQKQNLVKWLKGHGVEVHISEGQYQTVVGLVGDTSRIDIHLLEGLDMVESVTRISEPFKCANRRFHPADTIVEVGSGENKVLIGGGNTAIIAGPCSVESEEQIVGIARSVKASGASLLRGGAFKPRTSPYDFQGLREDGLELLRIARKETGLPIVTEIMSEKHLDFFEDVDLIQVGARNMQNFELLKALGKVNKPILLKRGLSATVKEWLMSAEYIMAGGNENIVLCERGIRSYDTYTRNVLDLSVIPVLRELTHLPVIVDPSHATGHSRLVPSMSLAAMAAGADGLIIEVHNDPAHALCDGAQSLTPAQFDELAQKIRNLQSVIG